MWGNTKDVSISEVGRNTILISFKDNRTGRRFKESGPWSIKGNLFNLQEWHYGESAHEVSHDRMDFWIQLHRILMELLKAETTREIGNLIGIVRRLSGGWNFEEEFPQVQGGH